jgi:microcystin-dependent protein
VTTSQQSRLGDAPEEGIKAPVKAVTSGNQALFDIGMTIAGYVVQDQDRIAVNANTVATENGIWIARGGKDWERATDFNDGDDVINGQLMTDANTSSVYTISVSASPWQAGIDTVAFGLLLTPVGFFWGAIGGTLSNQADLQAELDAKAAAVHTHVEADITDLQAYLVDAAGSIAADGEFYGRVDGGWIALNPAAFAPASHTHLEADILDLQPYLLDAAGSIANNDELYARANNGWQAFSTSSGTVGEIIAWPDVDPPDNFLICDGSLQNATTFADLFAVVGYKFGGSGANFNLPDLRGRFVRGSNNGAGVDPDAASRTDRGDGVTGDQVGTRQAAALGPHNHTFSAQQNIGGFTDNGGAPDQRSTQQNASTSSTGSGIEGDTRPINVQMNYIIRWTGGGSGITTPPTIEVQDTGITLTTAAQLFNFEGFIVTQPIADQITIRSGVEGVTGFCPGYDFHFLSTISWEIIGFDQTKLFRLGRRLRFIDGASTYYGEIISSSFTGGNTVLGMSMDTGLLTNTVSEVCMVTSVTSWAAIAADPFAGTPIRDIVTGLIGVTETWLIVGDGGKMSFSIDGGLTWTALVSGTSEDLQCAVFDFDNEIFWVGGDAGVLVTYDGTSIVLDTTSLPTLAIDGDSRVWGIAYSSVSPIGLQVIFQENASDTASAYSQDQGASWTIGDTSTGALNSPHGLHAQVLTAGTVETGPTGQDTFHGRLNNSIVRQYQTGITGADASGPNLGSGNSAKGIGMFHDGDVGVQVYGCTNARIIGSSGWIGDDTTTFTEEHNDFAFSLNNERLVVVGDNAQMGYWDKSDLLLNDAWTSITNGFDPLAIITAVGRNDADGVYVAVADNGQICRSTTGLGDPLVVPTFAGWTAIAADPFSGQPINRIRAGSIGGDLFWVAVGGGGLLFTSIDAGITWTQRTTGTTEEILCLTYASSNQTFFAGCTNGDFLTSTDGINWTLDNTTFQADAGVGSKDIYAVLFNAGNWWISYQRNVGSAATPQISADLVIWTGTDAAMALNYPEKCNATNSKSDNRIFWGSNEQIFYYDDSNDASDAGWTPTPLGARLSAIHAEVGSNGNTWDIMCGLVDGGLIMIDNGTVPGESTDFAAGMVNSITKSTVSARWIAVGEGGEIQTLNGVDGNTNGRWYPVVNPFTVAINDVWYDPTDDIMIAVSDNGVICRSVDGIS